MDDHLEQRSTSFCFAYFPYYLTRPRLVNMDVGSVNTLIRARNDTDKYDNHLERIFIPEIQHYLYTLIQNHTYFPFTPCRV
uniref:Uncharacterized protein n=1 Tax=Oncorhynchus kisutch TaxID=8019 RepID=A0A8C7HAC5_ONCKI